MLAAALRPGSRDHHVAAFERRFAAMVQCRHAIAAPSARLGLDLLLRRLDLPAGGEVIVAAFNYFVVIERLLAHGLRPVFADIRRDDLNVDAAALEGLVTPDTCAILATHMFGHPCRMGAIGDLAARRKLTLIEDCAHATGTTYRGRPVGGFGKAAIFSFSVMKLVTTFGGGMVTTNDDALAAGLREDLRQLPARAGLVEATRRFLKGAVMDAGTRTLPFTLGAWPALRLARRLRPNLQRDIMTQQPQRIRGWTPWGAAPLCGFQAALGRAQLERVAALADGRRQVAAWLDAALADCPGVQVLRPAEGAGGNALYYGVLADRAEELAEHLFHRGIDAETAEYCNCADLDIYREYARPCPLARDVQERIIRLPNNPGMTRGQVERVAAAIRAFYEPAGAPSAAAVLSHKTRSKAGGEPRASARADSPSDQRRIAQRDLAPTPISTRNV